MRFIDTQCSKMGFLAQSSVTVFHYNQIASDRLISRKKRTAENTENLWWEKGLFSYLFI